MYCRFYEFLVKGASPYVQREALGRLKDLDNFFNDTYVLKPKTVTYMDEDALARMLDKIRWEYESFNRFLLRNKRRPVFNTADLASCIEKRKELLTFDDDEALSAKHGVSLFRDYMPEVYENDLTCALFVFCHGDERFFNLLTRGNVSYKSLAMGIADSNEEAVNLELALKGLPPLFPSLEDKEATAIRREELLSLRPDAECRAYLDEKYPEWDNKDAVRQKKRFAIEAYSYDIRGTDPSGCHYVNYLGWQLNRMSKDKTPDADVNSYAEGINGYCRYKVFDTEDAGEQRARARELMMLLPADRVVEVKK